MGKNHKNFANIHLQIVQCWGWTIDDFQFCQLISSTLSHAQFAQAAVTKQDRQGKLDKFIFSQFWRLEVKIQETAGLTSGQASSACRLLPSHSLHMKFLLYTCGERKIFGILASSFKDNDPIRSWPHLYDLILSP